MRFESIQISQYGRLSEVRTPDSGLPSLVVILGPNEGGKSTFFSFLTTLLYGFAPATREAHPYAPWSGEDAEGRARLRLDDGSVVDVHRRLLSNGWGRMTANDRTEDIRNQPLPIVEHVPRTVFHQVYALTLAELAGLEGESWELIQDRLVGAMGASDVVPARSVAAWFEKQAGTLWRPSRRGNQVARTLASDLSELRNRRREAVELDRTLRGKVRELRSAEDQLRTLREERERGRVMEYRLSRLLPVRRKLERIDELLAEAGDAHELGELPPDPQGRLDELRDRYQAAEARIKRLDEEMAEPRRAIMAYTSQHRALADAEDRVRRVADRIAALGDLEEAAAVVEQEVRDLDRRCQVQSQDLFSIFWTQVDGEALQGVPTGELRDRVRKYQSVRDKRRIAEESLRRERPAAVTVPSQTRLAVGLAGVIVGILLFVLASFLPDKTLTLVLGAAAFTLGVVFGALWFDALRRARRYEEEKVEAERLGSKRIWELKSDEGAARERVVELTTGLLIHPTLLEVPTLDLPAGIERMQELLADREDRSRALADRLAKLRTAQEDIQALDEAVALPLGDDTPADANALYRALRTAIQAREAARAAERELERIRREKKQAETELNEIAALAHSLARRLLRFGDGDLNRGVDEATRRLELQARANQLGEELEREYPDLDDVIQEIDRAESEGESWSFDQEALARAAARREELTDQVENLRAAVETLKTEIQHLQEGETVDQIDSRADRLKEELGEAIRQRDRAFVLAQLVREADRRFRDEHQPDILRRAGEQLAHITGGRYDKILVGEGGDEAFYLNGPDYPRPMRVGVPVSTGTREQVYLALRLAIIDHLDARGERLPLFMDEAFVNWDAGRRDRAFGLLERISKDRQIFFFTCHPPMASELEQRGGQVITLGDAARTTPPQSPAYPR